MIQDANNFGNSGIRAVATKQGLVITFTKHALVALKTGKYGSVDLVSGGQKLHVKFMRDKTFKEMRRNEELMVEAAKEQEKEIADMAKELAE